MPFVGAEGPSIIADRASIAFAHSVSLRDSFASSRDVAVLHDSIKAGQEALDLSSIAHPERAAMCSSLALSLRRLYGLTGEMASLEYAMDLGYQAVGLALPGELSRPDAYLDLASSFRARYQATGDTQDLDEALSYGKEASDHPDRASFCAEHALSLKELYTQTGDLKHLNQAILLEREALEIRDRAHPERAASCHNLASSLAERFQQSGDMTALDDAMTLEREALQLLPHDHSDRASSYINLACMLRYVHSSNDLEQYPEEVISSSREAVHLRPIANPDRGLACSNLAVSLAGYAEDPLNGHEDWSLLDEAIIHEREALGLLGSSHPARVTSCINLAALLTRRYGGNLSESGWLLESTDQSQAGSAFAPLQEQKDNTSVPLIAEVSNLYLEAIQLSSTGQRSNVARCRARCLLANLYLIPRTPLFRPDVATDLLRTAASDPQLASLYDGLVLSFLLKGLRALVGMPDRTVHSFVDLVPVFRHTIERLQLSANVAAQKETQLRRMRDGSSAAVYALICAARANNFRAAVELSQHALTVLWSQALHIRDPQLDLILREPRYKQQSDKLQEVLATLASHDRGLPTFMSKQANATPLDLLHDTGAQLQTLVSEIRRFPGLQRFMRGHSYGELARAAQPHPIVILTAEGSCCHAVILSSSFMPPTYLCLPGSVSRVLVGGDGSDTRTSTHLDRAIGSRSQRPTLESALEVLWLKAVKPILECLGIKRTHGEAQLERRIHWCPVGPLVFVPFHAAGITQGPDCEGCYDYVVSSYTPSLSALLRARKDTGQPRSFQSLRMLAVSSSGGGAEGPRLCHVDKEVKLAAKYARAASVDVIELSGGDATRQRVLDELPGADIVHIAAHGHQNPGAPLESWFALRDNRLTIKDIMSLDLPGTCLAFLSACETVKGDHRQPDQAIHLGATFLFCGFASVIGTMWAVGDEEAAIIAKIVYERICVGTELVLDRVPYALHEAETALRTGKVKPAGLAENERLPTRRWACFAHLGA